MISFGSLPTHLPYFCCRFGKQQPGANNLQQLLLQSFQQQQQELPAQGQVPPMLQASSSQNGHRRLQDLTPDRNDPSDSSSGGEDSLSDFIVFDDSLVESGD